MKSTHYIIIGLTIAVALGLLSTFISCKRPTCDGKKCKTTLNLDGKPSVMDSLFKLNNPTQAKQFDVYVESSASMDGYVTGNTKFKTTLHRIIGQVVADVLVNDTSITLNYISSEVKKQPGTPKAFTQALSPASFSNAFGNDKFARSTTDVIELINNVVRMTKKGSVSMFVSDCVYSPEKAADIDKALKKQQTDMLNALKNKSKDDKSFGVLMYRMVSDFHGTYYNKTDSSINCNGDRPYFVWFFGDESILANVRECLSKIMEEEKADYIVGIPGYKYVPYNTIKSNHPYHYMNAKTNRESTFTFSFYADMSALPLSAEYIMDKNNYTCAKNKYEIKKIEPVTKADKKEKYDYRYTVTIHGDKNSLVTPTTVQISLKSMLAEQPKWVDEFDDPIGEDYDKGYKPNLLRTFGLKSLVDGVADFYKEPSYVTFRIQIN